MVGGYLRCRTCPEVCARCFLATVALERAEQPGYCLFDFAPVWLNPIDALLVPFGGY